MILAPEEVLSCFHELTTVVSMLTLDPNNNLQRYSLLQVFPQPHHDSTVATVPTVNSSLPLSDLASWSCESRRYPRYRVLAQLPNLFLVDFNTQARWKGAGAAVGVVFFR